MGSKSASTLQRVVDAHGNDTSQRVVPQGGPTQVYTHSSSSATSDLLLSPTFMQGKKGAQFVKPDLVHLQFSLSHVFVGFPH